MYEAVIGLEIHCELKTKTKMFSPALLTYGQAANTAANEIDLAHPGSLPSVNKKAVGLGLLLAQALACEVDPVLRFDRKHYFYSDLPKGYQITQQYYPLGQRGHFQFFVGDQLQKVRINRIHLEEDTAKQSHAETSSLIDFNRAGAPLVEVVTEADFRDGKTAAAYVDAFALMVRHLGVSDAVMAQGSLRCDVNISLRKKGQAAFGTKVEIKNLNSSHNIQKAIDYEIERQRQMLENKEVIVQETRRFDEAGDRTVSMRSKDDLLDYRYFRDPNLPNIQIPDELLQQKLPLLPVERVLTYVDQHDLSLYDAQVLSQDLEIAQYFDLLVAEFDQPKLIVNWLTQDLLSVYEQKGDQALEDWIKPAYFIEFLEALDQGVISSKQAKKVFQALVQGHSPKKYIKDQGMVQINDEALISSWIEEILQANPQVVADYQKGLNKSMGFVVGQVMKQSKGQANPRLTSQLVKSILDKKK